MNLFSPTTITAAFAVIVVISNAISAKLIALPFFTDFAIPAGMITYPFTFLLSDLMTELYGEKEGRTMVWTALLLSLLSVVIIETAIHLPSSDPALQKAFKSVLGLNGWAVIASLTAYTLSQTLDVKLYAWIRSLTGDKMLWLRNNGSTLVSQIVDTITVNWIFLYWGIGLEPAAIFQVMLFSYFYKASFSIFTTPFYYLLVQHASKRLV